MTESSRPVTLFTGQWADLPFEEVAALAAGWGTTGSRSPRRATTSTSSAPTSTTRTCGRDWRCSTATG